MAEKLTKEERAAMKQRMKDAEGESAFQEALAKMAPKDRAIGKRLHALIKETAPDLSPKTWYGMPAYANTEGKVVLYFRDAGKFKERYSMLGFNEAASLDQGSMWPIAYALPELTTTDEAKIRRLVKKAVKGAT